MALWTTVNSENDAMLSELASLDGTERATAEVRRPDRYRHLFGELTAGGPTIPRGAGLSYCGASFGDGVTSISSRCFDRILQFDPDGGEIVVEPGLSVGDLFRFAVTQGWYPPVLPGHPAITVGGCVAFNVHGKSQYHGGCFADHVLELSVFHPDHGEISCSPEREQQLFELTAGGFGLTGFITRVKMKLMPLAGRSIHQRRIPVTDLRQAVRVMQDECDDADCLYAWNDLNRRGAAFGRGIVYSERFDGQPADRKTADPETDDRQARVGSEFGGLDPSRRGRFGISFFRRPSAIAFSRTYGWLEARKSRQARLDLASAAFPIHGKEIYYQLFGRRGLREYQMLIPQAAWEGAAEEVEQLLVKSGSAATLGSLKLFRGHPSLLKFCDTGICLAIDVPASHGSQQLFAELDALVLRTGGLVNLSKDSRLTGELAEQVFPEYQRFKDGLAAHDPQRRFDSALRRRLGV